MIKLYTSRRSIELHNLKNVLESHGILCEIRGEVLETMVTTIPIPEKEAELWLLDDSREREARQIIAGSRQLRSSAWICKKCGESVEGEFGQCWNCQSYRPS